MKFVGWFPSTGLVFKNGPQIFTNAELRAFQVFHKPNVSLFYPFIVLLELPAVSEFPPASCWLMLMLPPFRAADQSLEHLGYGTFSPSRWGGFHPETVIMGNTVQSQTIQ